MIFRGIALVAVACPAIDIIRRTVREPRGGRLVEINVEGAFLGGVIGALVSPDLGGAISFGLVGAFVAYRVVFDEWLVRGSGRTKGKSVTPTA